MATIQTGSLIFRYIGDQVQYTHFQNGAFVFDSNTPPSVGLANAQLTSAYSDGNAIRLLFSDYSSMKNYIVSYTGITAFNLASSPMLTDPNATVTLIPSGDDQSGWLTRNGAIILTHENDTRLVRYESDSGKELDSFKLNDTEDTRFTFSADGTKWLMYNGLTGKLHLLRTWW